MAYSYTYNLEPWRIREYAKNVYIAAQQKDSRLSMYADWETQASKLKSYDVLGTTAAIERADRYGDTPNVEIPHSRRAVRLKEYEWGKLVDDVDVLKTLNDPTNPYVRIMSAAFKRQMDDIFIAQALGSALEGEDGDSSVALPNAQKIAAVSGGAISNLNVDALRLAKYKFDNADIDPDEERYLGITAYALKGLLEQTEITSSDYNTVKALVKGEIDTFMGFKFVLCNRFEANTASTTFDLTTGEYDVGGGAITANSSKLIAWVKSGVKMTKGKEVNVEVDKRADKRNIPQIYGWMSIGGVRMEDVKVIELNIATA